MPHRTHPRELIAAETAALVAERGLEAATLRRVAQRLDCTTGFISHYYSSKDDLLEAALDAAVRELLPVASTGAAATPEQWIDRAVAALPQDESSRRFWRVLVAFQAASLASERLAEVLRTYADEGKSNLFSVLRAASAPEVPDLEVQELTEAVWVIIDGFGTTAALNPQAVRPDFVRTALVGAVDALLAELKEKHR